MGWEGWGKVRGVVFFFYIVESRCWFNDVSVFNVLRGLRYFWFVEVLFL